MRPINRRQFLRYGILAGSGMVVGKGIFNTSRFQIENTNVNISIPGLPDNFKGIKIALLGDFHSSPIVSRGLLDRAAWLTMQAKPDIIFFVGDFVSEVFKVYRGSFHKLNDKYLYRLSDALSAMNAPMGIYGVLGNHDFWYGPEGVKSITSVLSEKNKVQWLRNRSTIITRAGQEIALVGVDDYWHDCCSINEAGKDLDKDITKILLSHNPDVNFAIDSYRIKIDLVLCGHTHGGQISLPFIGAPFTSSQAGQKYVSGLVRDGQRQTYVTRGVGHLMIPVRYNCPPDVTIITLG